MRTAAVGAVLFLATAAIGADLESRQLTHYIPQDLLETVVRTEGWTEITLNVKGGVRKGDVVRVWAGGSIDRGNGDQPSQFADGPAGIAGELKPAVRQRLALSPEPAHAYALLCKTEGAVVHRCAASGKPLEIKLTHDKERFWIGFNDERGRYQDNHLGKGRRHELDPLWVRIEVVRIIVD
jgi:hypothetical protein